MCISQPNTKTWTIGANVHTSHSETARPEEASFSSNAIRKYKTQ